MKDKDYDAALSREEIMKILTEDLGNEDFKLAECHIQPFSENPMGFLGIHLRICVVVEVQGEKTQRQYFAKKIPEDIPSHNAYAKGTGAFFKEIEFYEAVVRDVERNMTPGRRLTKWRPDYYFSRGIDILVVEDLCAKGFYMYPERKMLALDHVKATVRAMAAMHAGPMILEQLLMDGRARYPPKGWAPGQPTDLKHLYSQIVYETEVSDDPKNPGNRFYEAGFKSQLAIVDLLPNYTERQRTVIKEKLVDVLRRIFPFVKPSQKYRNTWVHGDLWSNNVMFRNGSDGSVEEAVIIDFQLARLVPPAHDVIMFIHQVQSREFLAKHESEILDTYYDMFTKECQAEGYEVSTILPRAEFDESCVFYYEFALLSQVMFFQMTLSPSHITSKFLASPELFDLNMLTDRTEMIVETYMTDELCRQRITEAMNELIKFYKLAE